MSTTLLYHGFGIKNYDYYGMMVEHGEIVIKIKPHESMIRCPDCGNKEVIRHGEPKTRLIQTLPIGMKKVFVMIPIPRIECPRCHAIKQIELKFADPYKSYTRSFERLVLSLCKIVSIRDAAAFLNIGWDKAKDILKRNLQQHFSKPKLKDLKYLAIDEISVAKGHKYLTLVMDLISGKIVFIGEGKGATALVPFWKRLKSSRAKIRAISTDMASGYVSAVTENCPNATLVLDHFHISKLMHDIVDELRRQVYAKAEPTRGKKVLKGVRWLLLKAQYQLGGKESDIERLNEALRLNKPLSIAYILKEKLRLIWSQKNKSEATLMLQEWINEAYASGIRLLMKAAKTVARFRDGILNWYDHRITTARLEGTNNKIRVLMRQSYGLRDMDFLKLRIMAIHTRKYAITG